MPIQSTMEIVRATALLVAFASAGAALLGLGGALSDRLDILTHFTPFYFAGGVLALVLAAGTGAGDGPALAAIAAILLSSVTMAPEFVAERRAPSATAAGGRSLKLMQFNLWARNADPQGTARWIEDEDADIVVVQEAVGAGAAVVRAITHRYLYGASSSATSERSTVILSKTKPLASGSVFGVGGKRFAGAWARFGEGGDGFTVVAAHFTWPIPAGPQQAQSRRLCDFLNELDRYSLIVAGDFNSTPWSFALRRQDARFALRRLTRGKFTWPTARFKPWGLASPLPFLPLDHVYAGKAWRAASVSLGPSLGSDHRPVVVMLERVL
jgi:endonuclease/exonuclease/phosphatase (EEP) superfamily protein YafD